MISRSQRIVGLDIGANSVKGIELAMSGGRFTVTGYAQQEIAAAGTLKDAIAAVIREGRFRAKQVVSSVSGRSVIVRYINTPFMKPDELRSSMRFEADKYIPFDVNEVILDCVPLDDRPSGENGEMRVVLVAVKKEVVSEHVRILQDVGLFPCVIDVDCFALGNAFESTSGTGADFEMKLAATEPAAGEELAEEAPEASVEIPYGDGGASGEALEYPIADSPGPYDSTASYDQADSHDDAAAIGALIPSLDGSAGAPAGVPEIEAEVAESAADGQEPQGAQTARRVYALVDIGAQKTNINIMEGFNSYFTREVYIGGEDMTEAIAKFLGISPLEAETVKRKGEQEAAVLEAVTQILDDLANEIFLSFDYFENQFDTQIRTVYLSGGGSRLKGIQGLLSQTLGREVLLWDPTAGIDIALSEPQAAKLRENAPQLAVAMGLASRLRKV